MQPTLGNCGRDVQRMIYDLLDDKDKAAWIRTGPALRRALTGEQMQQAQAHIELCAIRYRGEPRDGARKVAQCQLADVPRDFAVVNYGGRRVAVLHCKQTLSLYDLYSGELVEKLENGPRLQGGSIVIKSWGGLCTHNCDAIKPDKQMLILPDGRFPAGLRENVLGEWSMEIPHNEGTSNIFAPKVQLHHPKRPSIDTNVEPLFSYETIGDSILLLAGQVHGRTAIRAFHLETGFSETLLADIGWVPGHGGRGMRWVDIYREDRGLALVVRRWHTRSGTGVVNLINWPHTKPPEQPGIVSRLWTGFKGLFIAEEADGEGDD